MNIQERIMLTEQFIKALNDIPTERSATSLVVNVMVSPDAEEGLGTKDHFAKMVVDPETFAKTFAPDNNDITVSDASFFGYEVRYENNGVIVDCLMTKDNLKKYYGDIKLATMVPAASRRV